jgi:D-alanine-D-alanine ligase
MPAERPVKARVAVIGGGQNCEHEVSLASAAAVALALEHVGYQVVRLTIGADGTWHDSGVRLPSLADIVRILGGCDVVFHCGAHCTVVAPWPRCATSRVSPVSARPARGRVCNEQTRHQLIAADCRIATAPAVLLHHYDSRGTNGPGPS